MFVVLNHDRRQVVHFQVTQYPSQQWTSQQIVEAFPFDIVPRYLLRDRDSICGEHFHRQVKILDIEKVTGTEITLAITLCRTLHIACVMAGVSAYP